MKTLIRGTGLVVSGDVDGDGLDDILIGAPLNDDTSSDAGKSYLILGGSLGSDSTIDLANADYSFGFYSIQGKSK